ncbi:hypothetical protein [Noviherbaspirillum pedocola]|uniref:Uncharacterized protein n=1 Tax=Noviherbaspirillum pedocola TaxID=2801341 RepID=A0A934SZK9_9BURK|nr:hypothetical protein [Noviherbaspirillum pedocola]MBK4734633.1 hypothetical protein [Noviherbaspirillum pedocola]
MTLSSILVGLEPLAIVYGVLGVGGLLNHWAMSRWKKETETYTITSPEGEKLSVTVSTKLTPKERSRIVQEALAALVTRGA